MKINTKFRFFTGLSAILLLGIVIGSSSISVSAVTLATPPGDLFKASTISVSATATQPNESIWMLPGPRSLDPNVFGTPDNPLKTNWLPDSMRNRTSDNSTYTTTADMTPFSNKTKSITGSFSMTINDETLLDNPNSKDTATLETNFTDPSGNTDYYVKLEKLIPVGPDHPFFGGVGRNVLMHGFTEIGTPLMPTSVSYITLWGFGDLYINGSLTDSKRMIHVMVSQRVRTDNFELGFGVYDENQLEIHVILPNTKITSTGPIDDPVPTGFKLPNGMTQPFFHVNFYNIQVTIQSTTPTETVTTTVFSTSTGLTTETSTVTSPGFTNIIVLIAIIAAIPIVNLLRKRK